METNIKDMDRLRLEASIDTTRRGQRDGLVFGILGLFSGVFIAALGLFLGTTASVITATISGSILSGYSILKLVNKYIDGPNSKNEHSKDIERKDIESTQGN